MKRILNVFCMMAVTLLLAACSTSPSLQDDLMTGQWQGEMAGFPLTLQYTETDINVVDYGMSMPYKLEGDEITMDVPTMGTMVVKVQIDGDTMTQTNVATGEVSTLTRQM